METTVSPALQMICESFCITATSAKWTKKSGYSMLTHMLFFSKAPLTLNFISCHASVSYDLVNLYLVLTLSAQLALAPISLSHSQSKQKTTLKQVCFTHISLRSTKHTHIKTQAADIMADSQKSVC